MIQQSHCISLCEAFRSLSKNHFYTFSRITMENHCRVHAVAQLDVCWIQAVTCHEYMLEV